MNSKHPLNFRSAILNKSLRKSSLLEVKFRNLRIGGKLNVSFGILLILTFLVVTRSYLSSVTARRNIQHTHEIYLPSAITSVNAQANLLRMLSEVRAYLITGESQYRDRYQQARHEFEQELPQLRGLSQSSADRDFDQSLIQLRKLYDAWLPLPDQLFQLRDNLLKNQPALRLLDQQGEVRIARILANTQQILEIQEARSDLVLFKDITKFQSSFALMISALRSYLVTRNLSFRFEYGGYLKSNQVVWTELEKQRAYLTPNQQASLDQIAVEREQLLKLAPQMIEIVESQRYREDLYLFQTQVEPLTRKMLELFETVVQDQQRYLDAELQEGSESLAFAQWQIRLAAIAALLIASLLGFVLRSQIVTPIQRLTEITSQIAQGDFTAKAIANSQDEIGTLATTFNQMTQHLIDSHQALEAYNYTLEQRVETRTLEIQEKNEQLQQALLNLQQTQAQLVQTEKMSSLGQLVAGIAHEINNPVNFIHGNLIHLNNYLQDLLNLIQLYQATYPQNPEIIQAKIDDIELEFLQEDLTKILKSMRMGTERIREIVLSLRNFSRLDEAEIKAVDLHEGLESTLTILRNRLKGKKNFSEIKIIKNYGDLPLVNCYAGKINQVFLNILSNAIEAVEEKQKQLNLAEQDPYEGEIKITTKLVNPNTVKIEIADNGNGIAETARSRIFDPFFTTKPIGQGTGLGLSICYQIIVQKHGGKLEYESFLGSGTQFTIELPIDQNS